MEKILFNTTKTSTKSTPNIPAINLSDPDAKHLIVKASEEFGFFKVINHGVNMDFITKLESEAMKFFALPQAEKEKAGPPNPFGYGNKSIGFNGDAGCIEYLLFPIKANLDFGDIESFRSPLSEYVSEHCGVKPRKLNVDLGQNPENFRCALRDYVSAVNKMSSELLELMADGLGIEPRQVFSRLIMDEESESMFRINHYPPCPELLQASDGTDILGFGAHTDPQIISVLRANEASGYEILLRDGSTWASVPPDPNSFFVNIGDSLQVMTNGRFRSVRHRVLANSRKSRVSMVYFAAPPMRETIGPMPSLMGADQPSLYKEMTWFEYITNAHNMPLGHDRLSLFEKIVSP